MRKVYGDFYDKESNEVAVWVIEGNCSWIEIMTQEEYVEYTKQMAIETIQAQPFY